MNHCTSFYSNLTVHNNTGNDIINWINTSTDGNDINNTKVKCGIVCCTCINGDAPIDNEVILINISLTICIIIITLHNNNHTRYECCVWYTVSDVLSYQR